MSFVLDNSVAMLWLLPQSNPSGIAYAEKTLDILLTNGAVVPSIWSLEAANVISKSQRNGKITHAQACTFVNLLDSLDILVDDETTSKALHGTLDLARQFNLSSYDASYLELALRKEIAIATLDDKLRTAAINAGITLF